MELLAQSVEDEVVARATPVVIEGVGEIPVARAEEPPAMKVLSMTDRRLQDRLDALIEDGDCSVADRRDPQG